MGTNFSFPPENICTLMLGSQLWVGGLLLSDDETPRSWSCKESTCITLCTMSSVINFKRTTHCVKLSTCIGIGRIRALACLSFNSLQQQLENSFCQIRLGKPSRCCSVGSKSTYIYCNFIINQSYFFQMCL